MREPAEVCPHLMAMTACSRRPQRARERRRAKGIASRRYSQIKVPICVMCAGLCLFFFLVVVLVCVFSARKFDT